MVIARELPRVVLQALEGGEAKWGKLLIWLNVGILVFMAVIFFVTPEPWSEKLPTVPYFLGVFGFGIAYGVWMTRKPYRLHRMMLAKVLRDEPGRVTAVREIMIRPGGGGQRVIQETVLFDGESEFAPRPGRTVRVLGLIKVVQRSIIHVKIKGKPLARKLVVQSENAPELLSWLFATVAASNPGCQWGKATIGAHTGDG